MSTELLALDLAANKISDLELENEKLWRVVLALRDGYPNEADDALEAEGLEALEPKDRPDDELEDWRDGHPDDYGHS